MQRDRSRGLIRRRGAAAVADQVSAPACASAFDGRMKKTARVVPSLTSTSRTRRSSSPNGWKHSTHSIDSQYVRTFTNHKSPRNIPMALAYLVLLSALGLAVSENYSDEGEFHQQPHRVITQLRTNAFGEPNHQQASRVPEIAEGQATDETHSPEYVSTSMLRTSNQADDHEDDELLTPNEIQRQRRRRKRQRRRCSRLNLQKKCSLCRRQVRAHARNAVCHTVKSLEMYKQAGIKIKGASVTTSSGEINLQDSWSCYNTFDQCARRRLMIRMCGNAGRKAYDSCNVGKLPLPTELLEPSGTPERVDTCTDLPAQEYGESFVAEVEVECSEDGGPDAPIAVGDALNGVFRDYFQQQEDCGVFDDGEFDGCGVGRQVLRADVVTIDEGECYTDDDDIDNAPIAYYEEAGSDTGNPNGGRQRLLQKFSPAKNQNRTNKRRRRVQLKGRSEKSGKCRRKCANRNKKVNDSISQPKARRTRNLRQQFHSDVVAGPSSSRTLEKSYGICSPEATDRAFRSPDLAASLRQASDEVGFVAVRGTSVVETIDCETSERCDDGSNFCCGTGGCRCSPSDATPENCRLGTPSAIGASDGVCELFEDGIGLPNDPSSNLCCGAQPAIDECADVCVTESPTSSPSSPPTERCDLEFSTIFSPGNQANSVVIRASVTNLCAEPATLTRLSMSTCAKCIIDEATAEDCGGSFSILTDVIDANSLLNPNGATLDPDVTVEITLEIEKIQLTWDQTEGESITCAAYNTFSYGALTSQNGVSKTLVDEQQIFGNDPGLAIEAVDSSP